MTQILLLFGLLALGCGQIIYPDEYEKMRTSTYPNYYYTNSAPRAPKYPTTVYSAPQAPQAPQANGAANVGSLNDQINQVFYQGSSQFSATQVAQGGLTSNALATQAPNYAPTLASNSQPSPQDWNDHVNNIIARGITNFALDLDKAIYNSNPVTSHSENTIFSPLSIGVALSLVLLGSAGRTFDEVSRVLGLQAGVDISRHSEVVHQMFGLLLGSVNHRIEGTNNPLVNYASGIFVQEGYPIRSQFQAISENAYKSEVLNLDFQRRGREAKDIINNWVNQQTMGKIATILDKVPSPATNVMLLSALYFKGEWNQHFIQGATKRKEFFIEPNQSISVDLMYNAGPFPFYEDKSLNVKIVALPYKGLEMTMYVLLPKAEGATELKNFRDLLTPEIIENLINNMRNQTCILALPRMKLSSTLNLNKALQNLGLHTLFDPASSDLSLLSYGYGQNQPSFTVPQVIPLMPTALPQTAPQEKSINDFLIFTRVLEDDNPDARRNLFRYDDKIRGISVEQWNTGFQIRKIHRQTRDASKHNERLTYTMENEKIDQGDSYVVPKATDNNTKYIRLEDNKYRFQNAKTNNRRKRQSRPIDRAFLKYLQTNNFPSYGLDDLRNSANLVNPGLFAGEIRHKVEIDITEKGTEAAAVTSVLLERDGNQKRLIANRPFLFFIRHEPSKLILFWGSINKPIPNYAFR